MDADVSAIVGKKKRELYKLAVARSDIKAAMGACDLLLAEDLNRADDRYVALHNAMIVSYGRPFTANRPLGPLAARWTRFENERFCELHKDLLELRHKTVAHSDLELRKVFVVTAGAKLFETGETSNGLGLAVQNWALPQSTISDVRDLCMELGSSLSLEVETELQILYSGLYAPEPFELAWSS